MKEKEIVEIDLLDLYTIVIRRKKLIFCITVIGIAFSLLFSISSLMLPASKSFYPNQYKPKALMLINNKTSSAGSLSSLISSSGLSGLADITGVGGSMGSTYSDLAVFLVKTNGFLDPIITQFGLIERYKITKNPRTASRNALKNTLHAEYDKESGVFSISFTDWDPVFAQSVVNYAVKSIEKRFTEMGLDKNKLEKDNLEVNLKNSYNEIIRLQHESQRMMRAINSENVIPSGSSVMLEANRLELELKAQEAVYSQLKTQYELVKIQLASDIPVFQVLEYAEVPDQKSGPSRAKFCMIVTFASFLFSIFLAFLLNAIENVRKDPEAMAKLKTVSK